MAGLFIFGAKMRKVDPPPTPSLGEGGFRKAVLGRGCLAGPLHLVPLGLGNRLRRRCLCGQID